MELWIRSQDRENLKKINTGFYLRQDLSDYAKGEVIFIVSGGDKLGEYETKERALEVLDEIGERIMMLNTTNLICDNVSLVGFEKALGEEKLKGLCFPYQMPEE